MCRQEAIVDRKCPVGRSEFVLTGLRMAGRAVSSPLTTLKYWDLIPQAKPQRAVVLACDPSTWVEVGVRRALW
jgi:hypothetical protein